jgi:nucleotide-binding universal stress UspA family protein
MLQHILVGLDGSPLAESILPYVNILAKSLGAEVTLLHVVQLSEEMQRDKPARLLQSTIRYGETQARDYLTRVAQRLTEGGIKVRNQVVSGDAAAELVRSAEQAGIELIALATHGRSGLKRWVYGSVAEKVLHTTHTPLLLIRPTEEQATALQELTQIVVPLDGSPLAEAALPVAEWLAARLQVPLVLVRVVAVLVLESSPQLLESLQEAAEGYLHQLATRMRDMGISVHTEAPVGLSADKIVGYTHEHPGSLVVMTSHGRTGLAGLVLGSVARRVVQLGHTPTLIVRALVPPAEKS